MTTPPGDGELRLRLVANTAAQSTESRLVDTLINDDAAPTVWIVELATPSEARHIHGVYVTEAGAISGVVDLLTTRFVSLWVTSNVRMPNFVDFPTTDDWHRAVVAAWTLVDPGDVDIAWDEWRPH